MSVEASFQSEELPLSAPDLELYDYPANEGCGQQELM
jgi:hypothetical protein